MVDQVFTKRLELMPEDESIEQHAEKTAEENAIVEKDKTSADGIFKGLFVERGRLMRDEIDGVMRCPGCHHEYTGGPLCTNCGFEVDDEEGFSDVSDYDHDRDLLDGLELDMDAELGAEFEHMHGHLENHYGHALMDLNFGHNAHMLHNRIRRYHHHHVDGDSISGSEESGDSEDDGGSLQDFVVQDEDEEGSRGQRVGSRNSAAASAINLVSDEEDDSEDEGGAVNNRRQRRNHIRISETPESPYSPYSPHYDTSNGLGYDASNTGGPLTITDVSTNGSEAGDHADLLRDGWNPLEHETDSDAEGPPNPYRGGARRARYGVLDTDEDSDDSNTNTELADDEDDRSRESLSQTPISYEARIQAGTNFHIANPYEHQDDFDDDSQENHSIMDYDGDTDMSRVSPTSPRTSRDSRSMSANPYFNQRGISADYDDYGNQTPPARADRSISVASIESHGHANTAASRNITRGQHLGPSSTMQQADADSSDSSIHPPPRRHGRRPQADVRVKQYDPRISMIFADHQAMRGTGSSDNPISFEEDEEEEHKEEVIHIEPASTRRSMTAYRSMPARRVDPLRSSRSPSSTRVISSSQRNTRLPRQYDRRG